MKKHLMLLGTMMLIASFILALMPSVSAQALPEYAAQTGEPCSSCHISPSGGGSRGPRGQAWVASGKPSTIPDLATSLEILGVELNLDESHFTLVTDEIQAAEPPAVSPMQDRELFQWLSQYDGN